jgi:leucyl/phenylalanyl-tRNA--protein transferase
MLSVFSVPVYQLDQRIVFPPPEKAERSGLLAVGGDLRPERLLLAYSMGIFPWYDEDMPILWHSPDPRAVLLPAELHVPRSLAKLMRKAPYQLRVDTAFADVIQACADAYRPGQGGTWITDEMRAAYIRLHEMGYAHSAEAYLDDRLVGGLYGVSLGSVFFGESMFALEPDASKIAFVTLVRQLERWKFTLIDCQQKTEHLTRFGSVMWRRKRFQETLATALKAATRQGSWRLDDDIAAGAPASA